MPKAPRLGERATSICGLLVDHRGPMGEQCLLVSSDGFIEGFTEEPRGPRPLDLRGTRLVVAPGLVDLHVHLRGLRLSYKEDEYTGTAEAARGGVVLVADMPNTVPRLDEPRALAAKLDALSSMSLVDYAVYAAIPRDPGLAEALAGKPIAGFKVYPRDYGSGESLRAAARAGRLVVVHPELPEAEAAVQVEDPASRHAHRGCHWEAAAPGLLEPLLDGARVHVTHASCPSTVREARRRGYTVDVAPHHLLYEAAPGGDPCAGRVNPPLRPGVERSLLVQAVVEGLVDALASDHAPHAWWEKTEPLSCMPGYPWLGLWPWAAYRLLHPAMPLEGLLELAAAAPARILGVYGAYGVIEEGARASLIALDPWARWRHTGFPYSRHRLGIHFMLEAQGLVEYTLVGGVLVHEHGRVPGRGGYGWNPFKAKA